MVKEITRWLRGELRYVLRHFPDAEKYPHALRAAAPASPYIVARCTSRTSGRSCVIGSGAGLGVFRVVTVFTIVLSLTFLALWRFRVGEQPASEESFVLAHKGEKKKKKKKDKKGKKERKTSFPEESSEVVGAGAVAADSAAEPATTDRE